MRGTEDIFAKGWDPADVAQVLLVHVAAALVHRRCKPEHKEGRWLFALERAMRGRLAAGQSACADSLWTPSTLGTWPPLQPDGTLLPLADRLYFSADWHNDARWIELQERLKPRFPQLVTKQKPTKNTSPELKKAMKQQSLLNVRDASRHMVNVLTSPQPPDTSRWPKELYEQAWPEAARALWAAKPLPPPEPKKKRASGSSSHSGGGKQTKLCV